MFNPIELRHKLHRIPELAFEEYKTKALLMQCLTDILNGERARAFEIYEFQQSTGILVSYANGQTEHGYKLFRADMDALPSDEATECGFTSEHPGLMHACGHDVHMAVLMGLIHRVYEYQPKNNLLFLFQPAEEGKGGAQSIISEQVLQKYPIREVFALHVASELPIGTISSKAGIFFGIPQEFDVQFHGKASHVAFPQHGINALDCGISFYTKIKQAIAKLNSDERIIFHVGKMQSGKIRNIIADECALEGTHRTLSKTMWATVNGLIEEHAKQVAEAYKAKAETNFLGTYDPVVNNAQLEAKLHHLCDRDGYRYIEAKTEMTGEDFGFFTSMYPGLLFWLGSGSNYPLHSGSFFPKDECIEVGISVMWALAQS